jgi:hypothetical protein
VKREKYNLKDKPDPVPRMIQPRDPRYNVLLASHLKHNEKNLYHGIDSYVNEQTGCVHSSVCSGVDNYELGHMFAERWHTLRHPAAICIDAKRWDQHVGVPALKFEHSFYNLKSGNPELARLLRCQLHNKGIAIVSQGRDIEGFINYELEGRRMSGDINTSLGNKILMITLCLGLMAQLNMKPLFVNNGDDMVLFSEKSQLCTLRAALPGYFLKHGFQVVEEGVHYELEHITFCQMNPVQHASGWAMCRDPRVVLSKDHHCIQPALHYRTWLNSVGDCGRRLACGMPILEQFYTSIITGDKLYKDLHPFYFAPRNLRNYDITDECRLSFEKAFGIDPLQQQLMEAWLAEHLPQLNDAPSEAGCVIKL